MRNYRLAIVVVGLVLTLGAAASWGQNPPTNDTSDGNDNTGGGSGALVSNTTGTFNTAYGHAALNSNGTGILNTGIGQGALQSNDTGVENTAIGAGALQANSGPSTGCGPNCGINNTAIGFQALFSNGTPTGSSPEGGSFNTAVGNNALFSTNGFQSLGEANNNTAVGNNALSSNTGGSFNTAVGDSALLNATGSANIAVGPHAGSKLGSGNGNIYVGNAGGRPLNRTPFAWGEDRLAPLSRASAPRPSPANKCSSTATASWASWPPRPGTSAISRRWESSVAGCSSCVRLPFVTSTTRTASGNMD